MIAFNEKIERSFFLYIHAVIITPLKPSFHKYELFGNNNF